MPCILRQNSKYTNQEFTKNHFLFIFFLLPALPDFGVVPFLAATFGSVFFFFSDAGDLLTFFAALPEDCAPFAEDFDPF